MLFAFIRVRLQSPGIWEWQGSNFSSDRGSSNLPHQSSTRDPASYWQPHQHFVRKKSFLIFEVLFTVTSFHNPSSHTVLCCYISDLAPIVKYVLTFP